MRVTVSLNFSLASCFSDVPGLVTIYLVTVVFGGVWVVVIGIRVMWYSHASIVVVVVGYLRRRLVVIERGDVEAGLGLGLSCS